MMEEKITRDQYDTAVKLIIDYREQQRAHLSEIIATETMLIATDFKRYDPEESIDKLDVSVRLYNALLLNGVKKYGDLKELSLHKFKNMQGVGNKCVQQLNELLISLEIIPLP